MTITLCLSCSLELLNRRPRAHSAGCWLSLLHLISIFSGPQTPSGFPRAPSVVCGFPYHISSPTVWNSTGNSATHLGPKAPSAWCGFPYHHSSPTVWNPLAGTQLPQLPSWLHYIIVQRLHDRPLDLWNRIFNRHLAEITVMQFRCHSLPVRQSMRVSWDIFTSSHFISQFPPTRFPLITAIRMYQFLPVHYLEWHFWRGQKVKT